jgi:aryl-alcohol dehydrogenase-like predicted oxidoreductase
MRKSSVGRLLSWIVAAMHSSSSTASSSADSSFGISTAATNTVYNIPSVELKNGFQVKRIINGLWQTAGESWGVDANSPRTVDGLVRLAQSGFTSFDGADIYGPAEILMGKLSKEFSRQQQLCTGPPAAAGEEAAESVCPTTNLQLLTKYVPSPSTQTADIVEKALNKSASRMGLGNGEAVDMVQFHWWDYNEDAQMLNAVDALHQLQQQRRLTSLSLTNFDTIRLRQFVERGIPIVSNQVQYSVVDTRPGQKMAPFCVENNIHLLTYGSVLGGLLSDAYIGAKEPSKNDGLTPSKGKYLTMIKQWGGWSLFQELLGTLQGISDRHGGVGVSAVGIRWVLDQPAVGSVIVGVRPGVSDHAASNAAVFSFELTDEDRAEIKAVQDKANNLLDVIGDCGDEYR